ncbi:hypothetical protein ACX12M_17050 [Cellulosimicrobium cellulans]
MRIVRGAAVVVGLVLATAACGGQSDPGFATDTTPSASTTVSAEPEPTEDTVEPEPTDTTATAPDLDALTIDDLVSINGDATLALDDALATHGPEAVYVARTKVGNPALFLGEEQLAEVTNAQVLEAGTTVCSEIGAGRTLDEIFMEMYEAAGANAEQDSMNVFGDFVWSMILNAPDTLCPEHAQVKADWEASLH